MFYRSSASRRKKAQDQKDLDDLFRKYGYQTINTLRERARNPSLSARDWKHWRRLMRCAKAMAPKHYDLIGT